MSDRYYTGTSKSRSFDTTPIGVSDPVKVLESTIKKMANILNAFNDTNRSPEAAFKASGMRNQNIFNNQGRTDNSRLKRIYLSTRKALDTLQIPDNLSYTQRTILARLFPELEIMIGQSKEKLKGRFLPVYTVDKTQLNELIECYFPKKSKYLPAELVVLESRPL